MFWPFITAALVTLLLTKIAAMSVWLSVLAIIVEVLLLLLIGVVVVIYTVTGGRVALDSATLSFDINATPVPIPAVWPLMALTLGVLASRRRTACA